MIIISIMIFLVQGCAENIEISTTASDFFHVKVDKALLPVKVRGNTASNKIIVYIPGGPGGTALDVSELDPGNWKNNLEKEFAVAYYDQRGIGNAQGKFDEETVTLDQYIEDIHAIVKVLNYRYPDSRLYLMGHSFGAMLTYRYINQYGSEGYVEKYIAASGVATRPRFDDEHWVFRWDYVHRNAVERIERGEDIAYWEQVLIWLDNNKSLDTIDQRAQLYQYMQQTQLEEEIEVGMDDFFNIIFFSDNNFFPYYLTLKKRQPLINKLVDQERAWNIKAEIPLINQPILLIGGEYDISAVPEELIWIYNTVGSKEKKVIIVPDAGHDLFISQPKMFYLEVKSFIEE